MALGRGPDSLDAQGRDVNRGGEARRDVVDHLVEAELAVRPLLVAITPRAFGGLANPFVGLVGIIQAEVVVDRLGGEHGGQVVAQGLHPVERTVATDTDQAVDLEPFEPGGDPGDHFQVVGVDVVARGAQDRPAHRRRRGSRDASGTAGSRWTCGTSGFSRPLNPLMMPNTSTRDLLARSTAPSMVALRAGGLLQCSHLQ